MEAGTPSSMTTPGQRTLPEIRRRIRIHLSRYPQPYIASEHGVIVSVPRRFRRHAAHSDISRNLLKSALAAVEMNGFVVGVTNGRDYSGSKRSLLVQRHFFVTVAS